MRRGTLVGLALLVGLLAWLQVKSGGDLAGGAALPARSPLLVGFSPERVAVVRIDNLERAIQVKLERDAVGAWFLTDPIAYPATDALVRALLSTLARGTGEPDAGVDLAEVSLDPPKAVVELVQEDPQGARTFRMEVGAVDLDGSRIYVRVADHPDPEVAAAGGVVRATRTIYNTLDRNPDDYRERRATHLFGRDVVAFRRSGAAVVETPAGRVEEVDLTFDALLEPEGWKKTNPPVVTLDPNSVGLLARGAAELEVEAFTADSPPSFAPWGLDPPAFSIALEDGQGESTTLHFGHPTTYGPSVALPETWYCRREGYPHVWEVEPEDVALLTLPAESLVDDLLVRARRQDIRRVELRRGSGMVLLEREDDDWLVSSQDAAPAPAVPAGDGQRFPADLARVQDVIALLEKSYLGDHLPGVDFVPADPPTSISIVTRSGQRFGGDVGKPFRGAASGAAGPLFRRFGDEVCALVHEDVAALCELTLEDLRSRRIHRIVETELRWIRIEHDGRRLTYVQVAPTEWRPEGESIDAPRALTDSLATVLSLRAERWLPSRGSGDPPSAARTDALADALEVVVLDAGEERRFRLGRTADGTPVYEAGDLRAEVDFSQHVVTYGVDPIEALLSLFGR